MDHIISIVVPIYNVERYLKKCLNSLLEQTYTSFEVIMVNDGSTDGSRDICCQFAKSDERFILLDKENGGASSARNCGLSVASGEFICFVDSDDWVEPNYLMYLINGIRDADVVISKYILDDQHTGKKYIPFKNLHVDMMFEGEKKKKEIVQRLIFDSLPGDYLIKDTIMPLWKNMYRLDFLKQYKIEFLSERVVYYEDYIFNLQVYSKAKKVSVISDAQFVHVIHAGSLSQMYREGMYNMQKNCYYLAYDIVRKEYGDSYASICKMRVSEVIAYSLFKECQCDTKQAIQNIEKILSDEFAINDFSNCSNGIMSRKSRVIYFLAKYNRKIELLLFIKAIQKLETPYRYFQLFSR